MIMTLFIAFITTAAGFALCWFAKDKIIVLFTGTESLVKTLEAKAAALKAVL
jgi:hypothetical protein